MLTREVALIVLIKWLLVGGIMDRMACGMMIHPSGRAGAMPNAFAVSDWPGSIEISLSRMISAM